MNRKFTNRICLTLAALGLVLAFAACKKSDVKPKPPTITVPSNNGIDTTTIGDSIVLDPVVSAPGTFTYAWSVDGTPVAGDSTFHFTPTQRGDFQVTVTVANSGGSNTFTYKIHVYGAYENGFFIVNEGNYGSGSGTVSFYRYNTGQLEDSVYTKVNTGKDLGPNTSTAEYGAIWAGKFYILTKNGGPLVQTDEYSLLETGRIATSASNNFRAFLGLDSTHALVSTFTGIYPLNLSTMTLGTALSTVTGDVDDMTISGNYIFINSEVNGVQALNKTTYAVVATWANLNVGFAVTPDGAVYSAGDSDLVRIDPSTLDTTMVALPFPVINTQGYWQPGCITASTTSNTVFVGAYNPTLYAGTGIYQYVYGNPLSVTNPFINIATGKMLYAAGMGFDPIKQNLVVTTIPQNYGPNNDLDFYSPTSAVLSDDVSYTGYFYPAIPVFH
jgi:hypothetical protein